MDLMGFKGLAKVYDSLDGWCEKSYLFMVLLISAYQMRSAYRGGIAEIGVYKGKSFIPLCLATSKNESCVAIDCFDKQEFNRDNSGGYVTVEEFLNNVIKHSNKTVSDIDIIAKDSMQVSPQEIIKKGKVRIFSIDGSHTAESTYKDMDLAYSCLTEGGVIFMDDYFNPPWPGVSEGFGKWMSDHSSALAPVYIDNRRLVLCTPKYHQGYLMMFERYKSKAVKFWGFDVIIADLDLVGVNMTDKLDDFLESLHSEQQSSERT
jgi:hypothetical protein